jgi:hypothetical protein
MASLCPQACGPGITASPSSVCEFGCHILALADLIVIAGVSATSNFVYTIPDPIAEGTYSIRLSQGGNQSDVSPLFSIFMAPLNTSASATSTGIAGSTTYIYFDEHCGCTKTGLVPAATGNSMLANYTAPAMTTPALATYTGAATDLQTAWLPSLLVGAALVAIFAQADG